MAASYRCNCCGKKLEQRSDRIVLDKYINLPFTVKPHSVRSKVTVIVDVSDNEILMDICTSCSKKAAKEVIKNF